MSESGNIASACDKCGELKFVKPQSLADNCKCDNRDGRVSYTKVSRIKK